MKKSLIALAILSAAGAAAAQSSVTLYGRAEFGTNHTQSKTTNYDAAGNVTSSTKSKTNDMFGQEGLLGGNRIGLKGTEDLGGGTKLNFTYEMGVNPDATAGTFVGATRLANINVTGGFGSVTIGTFYNGHDKVRGYSPYLSDFSSNWADGKLGSTRVGRIAGTSTNALSYGAQFGPISFGIGATSLTEKDTKGTTTEEFKGQGASASVFYDDGPLSLGLAYGQSKQKVNLANAAVPAKTIQAVATSVYNAGSRDIKTNDLVVGGSYNFGVAKPFFVYQQVKAKTLELDTIATKNAKNQAFELGVSAPFGAATVWIVGAMGKSTWSTVGKGETSREKQRGFELGASYSLSKRTMIYGIYNNSQVKETKPTSMKKVKQDRLAATLMHTF